MNLAVRTVPMPTMVAAIKLKAGDQFERSERVYQVENMHTALHNKVKVYYMQLGVEGRPTGTMTLDMEEEVLRLVNADDHSLQATANAATNWFGLMNSHNLVIAGTSPVEIIITNRALAQAVLRFIAEREANGNSRSSSAQAG